MTEGKIISCLKNPNCRSKSLKGDADCITERVTTTNSINKLFCKLYLVQIVKELGRRKRRKIERKLYVIISLLLSNLYDL